MRYDVVEDCGAESWQAAGKGNGRCRGNPRTPDIDLARRPDSEAEANIPTAKGRGNGHHKLTMTLAHIRCLRRTFVYGSNFMPATHISVFRHFHAQLLSDMFFVVQHGIHDPATRRTRQHWERGGAFGKQATSSMGGHSPKVPQIFHFEAGRAVAITTPGDTMTNAHNDANLLEHCDTAVDRANEQRQATGKGDGRCRGNPKTPDIELASRRVLEAKANTFTAKGRGMGPHEHTGAWANPYCWVRTFMYDSSLMHTMRVLFSRHIHTQLSSNNVFAVTTPCASWKQGRSPSRKAEAAILAMSPRSTATSLQFRQTKHVRKAPIRRPSS